MKASTQSLYAIALLSAAASATAFAGGAVDERLSSYQKEGAGPFSAEVGERMWTQEFNPKGDGARSCTSCHGSDLSKTGKHQRTGKPIKPLSPDANSERLTDSKKIEKWFKRNCKWTLGRVCSTQEKGDFLLYIQSN